MDNKRLDPLTTSDLTPSPSKDESRADVTPSPHERYTHSVKRSVKRVMTRSRGDFQLTLGLTPEVGRRKSFFCSAASRQSRLSWASTGSRNIG